jgi:hypothetical protein
MAVEMFLLDPEGAAYLTVVVHPVPERLVMGFEIVAAPGSPALEFAFSADVQIGAVEECGFGDVVHAIGPSFEGFESLNPVHTRCANPL